NAARRGISRRVQTCACIEAIGRDRETAHTQWQGEIPVSCVDNVLERIHSVDGLVQQLIGVLREPLASRVDVALQPLVFADVEQLAELLAREIANTRP